MSGTPLTPRPRRAAPSPALAADISSRATAVAAGRADDLYWQAVRTWAADGGEFPSRARAFADADEELEVLCRWLGEWAALRPAEVFPPQPPVAAWYDEGPDGG